MMKIDVFKAKAILKGIVNYFSYFLLVLFSLALIWFSGIFANY